MTYTGMNATDGQQISELDHIRQSIRKILTTPVGSRVMRREFGSVIHELIDQPLHNKTRMQLMAACVMAICAWEPRVTLRRLSLNQSANKISLDIELTRRDGPSAGQVSQLLIPLKG